MVERAYIGVDVGSSGVRALAVDGRGAALARAVRPLERAAMSLSHMDLDLDLDGIWAGAAAAVAEAAAGVTGAEIRGLGLATQRHSLIVQDAAGDVAFASGNNDLRAALTGAMIDAQSGEAVMHATGHRPAMLFWTGKLAWIDAAAPEIRDRAARLLPLEAWLVHRLAGEAVLSAPSAAETGAWAIGGETWSSEHVPAWAAGLLPDVSPAAAAGAIEKKLADELGLPPGLPVAVGQPDTHAAELGTRRGDLIDADCATTGWSATVVRPTDAAPRTSEVWRSIRIGGGGLLESTAGDASTGYQWIGGLSADGQLTNYASGTRSAAEQGVFAPSGLRVMDIANPNLAAAGVITPVPFLEAPPDLDMLATAVLEDLGFALKGNRDRLEAASPVEGSVRLTGGYMSAPASGQILANVLGAPVASFAGESAAAAGAAMCAAAAAGDADHSEAAARMSMAPRMWDPDPRSSRMYADHYGRWLELRKRLDAFVQEVL